MEVALIKDGKASGKKKLPSQFQEPIRFDLIKRAVVAIHSHLRQAYGALVGAGQRQVGKLSRRRRKYKGSYSHGISRVPRKTLNRRGERMFWVGAVAPGTVGGREAHPPKSWKIWDQKINKKENRKAIRSALAASLDVQLVKARGHAVPKEFPFIISGDLEKIQKTQKLLDELNSMGLADELARASVKNVRAGHGKSRGRRYQRALGPLIVVSEECPLIQAASNIPGVDAITVNKVNCDLLAPGAQPGRLTLYTDKAIDRLAKEDLFN